MRTSDRKCEWDKENDLLDVNKQWDDVVNNRTPMAFGFPFIYNYLATTIRYALWKQRFQSASCKYPSNGRMPSTKVPFSVVK